jgi:hypothetical protein
MQLRNESKNEFTDISSEASRTYVYRGKEEVTISEPAWLNVSKSGGHRLLDLAGCSHYLPPGWIHLKWTVKEGQPHFVK